jgi:hypothetical protein
MLFKLMLDHRDRPRRTAGGGEIYAHRRGEDLLIIIMPTVASAGAGAAAAVLRLKAPGLESPPPRLVQLQAG